MHPPQAPPPVSLPPLQHLSSAPPTPSNRRHGPAHPLLSILNPQAELAEQQRSRRSVSQVDSLSPIDTQHSQSLPSISRPTSVDSSQEEGKAPRSFPPPGRPAVRHLLSPQSPRLHRTQSLGLLNPPTGTIDAHQSPFLTANTRPSDPAHLQPTLPTPPAGSRPAYFTAAQSAAPTPPPNLASSLASSDVPRPGPAFPQSGSASPIAQYSPYSQAASIASSQFESHSAQGHYGPGPSNAQHAPPHSSRASHGPPGSERSMIAMAPSSQSSIQLMTIKSQQGHPVQIPVDVQAASKVADEKRRRNAGASARFRARRKEKEREASMSISRLEQQLRDAIEDAEYYRVERDYFKSIVHQQPHPDRHYARPPSPRLRRHSAAPSLAPSSTGVGSDGSYADYEDEPREEERNVRRRTSSYHPVPGPAMSGLNNPGSSAAPYPQGAYPSANSSDARAAPQPYQYPSHPPPGERPIYRDPFAPNTAQYEQRS